MVHWSFRRCGGCTHKVVLSTIYVLGGGGSGGGGAVVVYTPGSTPGNCYSSEVTDHSTILT